MKTLTGKVNDTSQSYKRAFRAFGKLTTEERVKLFRELGSCTCSDIRRYAVKNPSVAIGALLGGILGKLAEGK